MNIKKTQNQIFRQIREKIGVTQAFIAKETGIDRSKLSLFENGYKQLSSEEKKRISQALGMNIFQCFGQKKSKKQEEN